MFLLVHGKNGNPKKWVCCDITQGDNSSDMKFARTGTRPPPAGPAAIIPHSDTPMNTISRLEEEDQEKEQRIDAALQ